MIMKHTSLAAAAAAGLALSGCSGGAGSMTQAPVPTRAEALADPATAANVAAAIGRAVDAVSAQGSATRSSEVDADGITTDRVSATARHGDGGPSVAVRNGAQWSIGSHDGKPVPLDTSAAFFDVWQGAALRKRVAGGTLYVDAYTDIGAPSAAPTDGTYTSFTFTGIDLGVRLTHPAGRYRRPAELDGVVGTASCADCSFVYTVAGQLQMKGGRMTFTPSDGSAPTILESASRTDPDTDYLAGGLWLFVPDDASRAADLVFGAFADGSDPFDQSGFAGLTGTARYVGDAAGAYSETGAGVTDFGRFVAYVQMTANFDRDVISGSINDFVVDGVPKPDFVVFLDTTGIGSQDSGFFNGIAGGTYAGHGTPTTGRWSGRFFGNGEADGKPGSVGGTFGVQSEDGVVSAVGIFGAHKQ